MGEAGASVGRGVAVAHPANNTQYAIRNIHFMSRSISNYVKLSA